MASGSGQTLDSHPGSVRSGRGLGSALLGLWMETLCPGNDPIWSRTMVPNQGSAWNLLRDIVVVMGREGCGALLASRT